MRNILRLGTALAAGFLCAAPVSAQTYVEQPDTTNCRDISTQAEIDGVMRPIVGTACLQADGSWQFVGNGMWVAQDYGYPYYYQPWPWYWWGGPVLVGGSFFFSDRFHHFHHFHDFDHDRFHGAGMHGWSGGHTWSGGHGGGGEPTWSSGHSGAGGSGWSGGHGGAGGSGWSGGHGMGGMSGGGFHHR